MSPSDSQDRWLERQLNLRTAELKLRIAEVEAAKRGSDAAADATRLQRRTSFLQVLAVTAGLLASCAAAYAAFQAGAAVRASEQGTEQQSADNQLSIAISAIGGSTPAERVAGMTLLDLNVRSRMLAASGELPRRDAFGEYVTAIDVLANYVRDDSTADPASPDSASTSAFGPGYGYPTAGQGVPFDVLYAAAELRDLLSLQTQVTALQVRQRVGVDLSNDDLFGLSWAGVRFNWVDAYMPKIDLRGANLADSSWAGSDLAGSFLQCADLSGADLAGANLTDADLRGANVAGANFAHADLRNAKLADMFGTAVGLKPGRPARSWNPDPEACARNRLYWDVPRASPAVTSSPSASISRTAATKRHRAAR